MPTIPAERIAQLKSPAVLLAAAVLMAAAVSWIAYHYLQQREATIKAEVAERGRQSSAPKVSVAVPLQDAPVGTALNLNNFVARPVDADLVYPDTILAADFRSMEGLKLARPVLHGRPLRMTDLAAPEVRDVASILPNGQRALTLEIDNINSIAQTLRPSNHIDIFLVSKAPQRDDGGGGGNGNGEADATQTSLYMQDLVVLATGTDFQDVKQGNDADAAKMARPGEVQGKERGYNTVTVLVSPREAAQLITGQKLGAYRVALRSTADRATVHMAALRAGDLLPNSPGNRDGGIEFIVGGKGNMISQLSVPPSQDMAKAMQQASMAAPSPSAAAAPAPAAPAANDKPTMTVTVPLAPRGNVSSFNTN